MAKPYDPKTMSLKKLGACGTVPALPMLPIGAQMVMTGMGIKVHYKVDDEGHYVNGALPAFPPSRLNAIRAAVQACADEPSYSETGQVYKKLTVAPDPKHADRFLVKAGTTLIGFGMVEPSLEVVSTDEPIEEQVTGTGDGEVDDADNDDDE